MKKRPLIYFEAKPPKLCKHQSQTGHCFVRYLLYFIKDNAAGLIYPEQPDQCCHGRENAQKLEVRRGK